MREKYDSKRQKIENRFVEETAEREKGAESMQEKQLRERNRTVLWKKMQTDRKNRTGGEDENLNMKGNINSVIPRLKVSFLWPINSLWQILEVCHCPIRYSTSRN
jgi:hypothetical protein